MLELYAGNLRKIHIFKSGYYEKSVGKLSRTYKSVGKPFPDVPVPLDP